MKEHITVIFFVACQCSQASCSSLIPDPIVDYQCISNRNSKMDVIKAQIVAWLHVVCCAVYCSIVIYTLHYKNEPVILTLISLQEFQCSSGMEM